MQHGWQFLSNEERRTVLDGLRDAEALNGPYHLEMDWTDRCNARCFFCNNAARNREGAELPVEIVRGTLDGAIPHGLKSLRLSGGGEPLFHREIGTLLDLIEERELVVDNLTTNGVLIDEAMARRFVRQIRTREIIVSLNYPDPESYAEAMSIAPRNFDRVVEGLDYLDAERQAADPGRRPRIILQFFVSKQTQFDIPRMVEIGKAHGVDHIHLRDLWKIDADQRIAEDDKERVKEDLRRVVMEDADEGRILVSLIEEGLDSFYGEIMREIWEKRNQAEPPPPAFDEYCYVGHHSVAIRGNGDVFPCCMMMLDERIKPIGNLHEAGLMEIWRGEGFGEFRKEMERVQLLKTRLDFDRQDFRRIAPVCATHYGCGLASTLCDRPFYEEAERLHQRKRRALRGMWVRLREMLRGGSRSG